VPQAEEKHRNDVLFNPLKVLKGAKAGVAVSSAFAEAGFLIKG